MISAGLHASGVGSWAAQILIQGAGASVTRLLVYVRLLCSGFSTVISVNGAIAAMPSIAIVVAVRTAIAPSKLPVPIMCSDHAACESIGMTAEVFEGVCTDLPPVRKR
jgi:Na+/H+ antiporter NhaD/arsenite permease-like protein